MEVQMQADIEADTQSPFLEDRVRQVDPSTVVREISIRPAMCGHNSLLVGQIGDWTWEVVSRACGVDAFRAEDGEGNPTYLSFYYYHLAGDRAFHLRTPTFGDRLQVVSTCYGVSSESVLTIHRLANAELQLPAELTLEELHGGRRPAALYVQTFNRWIRRGNKGNSELHTAAPLGFRYEHLAKPERAFSPRLAYDPARRNGAFPPDEGFEKVTEISTRYEVDLARDLNGVGLLYFASYFSIVDGAIAKLWRRQGNAPKRFLDRVVKDKKLCFLGNAEPGSTLEVLVSRSAGPRNEELRHDVTIIEESSGRRLAVAAVREENIL